MVALWWVLACSGADKDMKGKEGECSANCTDLITEPADGDVVGVDAEVTLSVEPADRAISATLIGPDGEELGAVYGEIGSANMVLPNTLPEGELELIVETTCDPAPAAPCNETTLRFTVSDEVTTTTTTTTPGLDVIEVPGPAPLDLLLVVDDSCSMSSNQASLSQNLPSLFEYFLGTGLDYHIGVVTTTPDNGALRTSSGVSWLDPETPSAMQTFTVLSQPGTDGIPDAQAFTTSQDAIEAADGGINDGFTRPDANLVVMVVSDSDDKGPITASEYISWIEGLGRPSVDFVPIVPFSGYDAGTSYLEVADALGSPSFELSTLSADVLGAVGRLAQSFQTTFCTREPAVDGTLEVEVHNLEFGSIAAFEEGDDWVLTEVSGEPGSCIEFLSYVPDSGAEVHLSYEPR